MSTSSLRAWSEQQRWRLSQANLGLANALLSIAAVAAPRDPDGWAAKVVHWARQHGVGDGPQLLLAARAAAFAEPLTGQGEVGAAGSPRALSLSEARALATAFAVAKGRAGALEPRAAPGFPTTENLRSDAAALAAFNQPTHWGPAPDGLLVPTDGRLHADVQRTWREFGDKFGQALARRMFDANVRGGTLAVIAVLNVEGSRIPLALSDVTQLQYLAIADGLPVERGAPLRHVPTLHDAVHSLIGYGVSELEEVQGDAFAESMLDGLFGSTPQVAIDRDRPLIEQPAVVRELAAYIDRKFDTVSLESLLKKVASCFVKSGGTSPLLKENWDATPMANARRAEQVLEKNGLFAHLSPAAREQLRPMFHGVDRPDSFEAVVRRRDLSGDSAQFTRDVEAWAQTVTDRIRELSSGSLMSRDAFKQRAAKAIAVGLLLDRISPRSLRMGPSDTELKHVPELALLDLRTAYPPVLVEVQNALGIRP